MKSGIINVYKESGYTSHDVVARLRKILNVKKIGHTGTLDPMAEGVLPVCIGAGTKLSDMLMDHDKEYVAELLFGVNTDTDDITGNILRRGDGAVTRSQINGIMKKFLGKSMQVPPMYSARKIGGKKLYELAREGQEVEREAREIEIKELELISLAPATVMGIYAPVMKFRVVCSKGTYIRTLCRDIGEYVGCGGTMAALLRSRVGNFRLEDAYRLHQIEELFQKGGMDGIITAVDELFLDLPEVFVQEDHMKAVENGNPLFLRQIKGPSGWEDGDRVRVYGADSSFYGIYAFDVMKGMFRPEKMFFAGHEV